MEDAIPAAGYFPAPQLNGYVVHDQRIPSNPPDQATTPGISAEIELAARRSHRCLSGRKPAHPMWGRLEAKQRDFAAVEAAGVPGTSR